MPSHELTPTVFECELGGAGKRDVVIIRLGIQPRGCSPSIGIFGFQHALKHPQALQGIKRRAAARGKVAWRARRIIVPATPTFAIATSGGDPARNKAARVHDHGRLTLRNQIKPGVQIGPVLAVYRYRQC